MNISLPNFLRKRILFLVPIKSAQILPQVVYNPWIRLKICIVIAANKMLFKKINKNKKSFFSMIDYVKAMIYGTFKWVFIRTKSLNTKGI